MPEEQADHPSRISGALGRPFTEQVAFFRNKMGNRVPTQAWDDLTGAEHDRAFMVAGAVKADLLSDLIGQMNIVSRDSNVSLEVTKSLAEIQVYPDQAVPMSLLTAEALTNAGKYMTPDPDGIYRMHVDLKRESDRNVVLEITNSVGEEPKEVRRGGLGNRLIQAFATQLGGTLNQGVSDGRYRVRVLFSLSDFKPEVVDY